MNQTCIQQTRALATAYAQHKNITAIPSTSLSAPVLSYGSVICNSPTPKDIPPVKKTEWWASAGVVIYLERAHYIIT